MAEVCDNKFVPPSNPEGEWWLRDSIQFGLDPLKDGGENVYPWKLPDGDITTYRVAVPWKQISGFTPSVGAECRFSVVVNDCDVRDSMLRVKSPLELSGDGICACWL